MPVDEDNDETDRGEDLSTVAPMRFRFRRLKLSNFLSYRDATIEFGDLVALVGPNSSGKSNAVAAIKLLREIPLHGLPTAVARRGGFDQLRHRSRGRPYNPSIRIEFELDDYGLCFYDLKFFAVEGKRYEIREAGEVHFHGRASTFSHDRGVFQYREVDSDGEEYRSSPGGDRLRIPAGQSVIAAGGYAFAVYVISSLLQSMQTVEINPTVIGELQAPSSVREFEPDGANIASVFDGLETEQKAELVNQLSSVVPSIDNIYVKRLADRLTLVFVQNIGTDEKPERREFFAKQMSDGTLRAFGILTALIQPTAPSLVVIEEPEVAIHLGALASLVDVLHQYCEESQIVLTTHSADIVDLIGVDDLRVVWSENGASHIAAVAAHTASIVKDGLISVGTLLRSDSLDPLR